MFQTSYKLFGASLIAVLALASTPALASGGDYTTMTTLPAVQINTSGFGSSDNTSAHLFKIGHPMGRDHLDLFALTDNANGIQLWRAGNEFATSWTEVTDSQLVTDGENTSVIAVRAFEGRVYTLLNSDTGFQLWRWEARGGWTLVHEEQDQGTVATALASVDHKIAIAVMATDGSDSAQVHISATGKNNWEQLGETGFGLSVGSIVSMDNYDGVLYAVTDDNQVVTIDMDGAAAVNADLSADVTGLQVIQTIGRDQRAILIGGTGTSGAVVYSSTDGATWTQQVSDGFGDASNTTITKFRLDQLRKSVQAYTENSSNGFEIFETGMSGDMSTWQAYREAGVTDTDNTEVSDAVIYRSRLYTSTMNSVDGAQVYLTQVRPPKPDVTSPAINAVLNDATVTIEGTAQAGNKITLWRHGGVLESTTADANGNWSITLPELESGQYHYNVRARYQTEGGDLGGKLSRPARVHFTVSL